MTTVFLETTGDRHLRCIGGLTALERRIRDVAKQGATRVVVGAPRVEFPRQLPISVEFGDKPADARVERADVVKDIELVDDDAAKRAEWALIRRMNKSHEGPVDALINWLFSMRITRVLSRFSLAVTPNHVTIVAILVGIAASIFALRGGYLGFGLSGVLLEVQSILDSVDGELARLRFQYSSFGQWLDNVSDDIVDNAYIAAVGYSLGGVWLKLGIAAAAARLLHSISTYIWVYATTGTGDVYAFRWWFEAETSTAEDVYSPKSPLTWLRSLGRRDTYVFLWMIACVCGLPQWVVVHAAVIAAINVALLLLHFLLFRRKRV